MTCPRCQQENPLQARFCMKCGAGLTLACAKCNTELPTGAGFCFACGQPVTAAPGGQRFTSPEAYTPQHLAEKIEVRGAERALDAEVPDALEDGGRHRVGEREAPDEKPEGANEADGPFSAAC